jgi:ATP-dependent RNA helicase DDX3X
LATSFYNDKDEPIAEDLIKILLECGQQIPDFLEDRKPTEGEPLVFDDDSGDDDEEDQDAAGDNDATWGNGEKVKNGDAEAGDTWVPEKLVAAAPVEDNNNWDAGNNQGG